MHPYQGQLSCSEEFSATGPHSGSPSQAWMADVVSACGLHPNIVWTLNGPLQTMNVTIQPYGMQLQGMESRLAMNFGSMHAVRVK